MATELSSVLLLRFQLAVGFALHQGTLLAVPGASLRLRLFLCLGMLGMNIFFIHWHLREF